MKAITQKSIPMTPGAGNPQKTANFRPIAHNLQTTTPLPTSASVRELSTPHPMDPNSPTPQHKKQWFVLREFRKRNAKSPAFKVLPTLGIQCFTPMHWVISSRFGKQIREYVPVVQSLLFAYDTPDVLAPIIEMDPALQFQYKRGGGRASLMTVPDDEMQRFIHAVNNDPSPIYYTPEELTPDMIGRQIIVKGGPLDGYSGLLLKMRGSRKRRLLVKIEGFLAAAVEVSPEFIHLPSSPSK